MDAGNRRTKLEELKKQREELDKVIRELQEASEVTTTNIPYAKEFLLKYLSSVAMNGGSSVNNPQSQTGSLLKNANKDDILMLKLFINKKMNQITADYSHTMALIEEMMNYKSNELFQEILVHKLIDQGRIQVSSHFDSYKPLSFILTRFESEEMVEKYIRHMITKEGSINELRGIYSIYFGYLNLKGDSKSSWFWGASVLNIKPNECSGYVMEIFLEICGRMMLEECEKFRKLLRYIKSYFIKEIGNEAVESRVKKLVEGLLESVK